MAQDGSPKAAALYARGRAVLVGLTGAEVSCSAHSFVCARHKAYPTIRYHEALCEIGEVHQKMRPLAPGAREWKSTVQWDAAFLPRMRTYPQNDSCTDAQP